MSEKDHEDQKGGKDNGDRRSGKDRRQFKYTFYIPERRNGPDRREPPPPTEPEE